MGDRFCKYNKCGKLIPETRRKDAIYCTDKCRWTYRNKVEKPGVLTTLGLSDYK